MIAAEPDILHSFRPPLYASPQRFFDGQLPPTAGPLVAKWQESLMVHGEGDSRSKRVHLAPHQRYILNRLYEYHPETKRLLVRKVVVGIGKGNSKTEDAARIGLGELAGPVAPLLSPHVVTSAASIDQADHVYGAAKTIVEESPRLAPHFHTFETELFPKDGRGIMKRIAARGGTKDGGLPTCHIGDELHEWRTTEQRRVYVVQGKSLRKRVVPRRMGLSGALQISITTAGDDIEGSVLGEIFEHGLRVASGEVVDHELLFLWWGSEKTEDEDLDNPEHLDRAILAANPGVGFFQDLELVRGSYFDPDVPTHEFERYNLNRWVSRPKAWLAAETWKAHATELGQPPEHTPIVLGFRGTYNRNSTALVGWTPPGGAWGDYGFVVAVWDRDDRDANWTVPRDEVEKAVADAFEKWDVLELVCEAPGWVTEVESWGAKYGGRTLTAEGEIDRDSTGPVLQFAAHVNRRMGEAVDRFQAAVLDAKSGLRHDGHPALARHIQQANSRETVYGPRIVQDRKDSPRKIDLAVAAVIARQRSQHQTRPEPRKPVFLGSLPR